jgi:subtilisin family serine protease
MELDTESGFDYLYVETSPDGVNWTVQSARSGTTNGSFFPFESNMASLDGYATAQVRFRLDTDVSIFYGGYHLDDIQITAPNTSIGAHSAADYAFLDGTSMATPNVAGAAALVWANEPTLTVQQIKSRLLDNGDNIASLAGKTSTGKRVNVVKAMPMVAPTGLSANTISSSQVNLTWTDNAINEETYLIQRNSGAGFVTVATVYSNMVAYSDTSAPANSALTYQVMAQARDGRLTVATTATAQTPAAPTPTPTPTPSGGGCVMGVQQGGVDPLFPVLMLLALGSLYRRRKSE